MKTILLLLLICSSAFAQTPQIANVTYNFSDFTGMPQNVAEVTITPFSSGIFGNYLVTSQARAFPVVGTNTITVPIVMGYSYQVQLLNPYYKTISCWTNQFPATLSGNVNGSSWIFYSLILPQASVAGSLLWSQGTNSIYPSGITGTNNNWLCTGFQLYPNP